MLWQLVGYSWRCSCPFPSVCCCSLHLTLFLRSLLPLGSSLLRRPCRPQCFGPDCVCCVVFVALQKHFHLYLVASVATPLCPSLCLPLPPSLYPRPPVRRVCMWPIINVALHISFFARCRVLARVVASFIVVVAAVALVVAFVNYKNEIKFTLCHVGTFTVFNCFTPSGARVQRARAREGVESVARSETSVWSGTLCPAAFYLCALALLLPPSLPHSLSLSIICKMSNECFHLFISFIIIITSNIISIVEFVINFTCVHL